MKNNNDMKNNPNEKTHAPKLNKQISQRSPCEALRRTSRAKKRRLRPPPRGGALLADPRKGSNGLESASCIFESKESHSERSE